MPLYVVRWPNLSAALVRAEDEDELIDILDEEADPEGCRWQEYFGPLFLDFELGAKIEVDDPEGRRKQSEDYRPLDPEAISIGVETISARDNPLMTITPCGCKKKMSTDLTNTANGGELPSSVQKEVRAKRPMSRSAAKAKLERQSERSSGRSPSRRIQTSCGNKSRTFSSRPIGWLPRLSGARVRG